MFSFIAEAVAEFLSDCEARGHSRNTLTAYRNALRFFVDFFAERQLKDMADLTPALLREYSLHCSSTLKAGGAHARMRPVKTFLKWSYAEELLPRDLTKRLPMPKLPREPQAAVRKSEFMQLLEAARRHSRKPLRDIAILTLLIDTGLRATEAMRLELSDIKSNGVIEVRYGKGGKSRLVPVERPTLRAIRAYVATERPNSADTAVIFLAEGEPMSRKSLDKLLERLCQAAGVKRFSAHTFRRGFAVQFLQNGGDVFTLQRIFGHTSLEMTNRYAQLLTDDIKNIHRRASPLRQLQEY